MSIDFFVEKRNGNADRAAHQERCDRTRSPRPRAGERRLVVRSLAHEARARLSASRTVRDLPKVTGDRVQLQQVVLNLVLNGLEAMGTVADRPRELVIETKREEAEHVCVAVRDVGIGLDSESINRLFDAFYTTKRGFLFTV